MFYNSVKFNRVILKELFLHPKSSLIDYYKMFYQDYFGPGHIIADEGRTRTRLVDELSSYKSKNRFFYQDISCKNNFLRLDLKIIDDKNIEIFLKRFIESSVLKIDVSFNEWALDWQVIQKVLLVKLPHLDREPDKLIVNKLIQSKEIPSHSDSYKINYNPHYRLICKEFFREIAYRPQNKEV